MSARMIQSAPGARACCDQAGRLCAIAFRAIELERLVALAVFKGEGSEAEVRARIVDMLAGGALVEL